MAGAMLERPATGNRAVLVQVDFGKANVVDRIAELSLLAGSAGAETVALVQCKRQAPDAALVRGQGARPKKLPKRLASLEADIVIFNHWNWRPASSAQSRTRLKATGRRPQWH